MAFVRHVLRFRDTDSLGESVSSPPNLFLSPRAITPSACYDDCNNSEATKDTINDYIDPEFRQFQAYCDGVDSSTPATTTINSDIPCAVCTPLIYTDPTGKVHTVMVKPGLEDLSKTPLSAPSQTSSADEPKPSGSNSNKVVAVVVVIIVLLAALFFWRRRRPKKNIGPPEDPPQEEPKYEKAQLHSDCIPRGPQYELEGSVPPVPSVSPAIGEMTANEVAAQEMPTSQKSLAENDETEDNTPRQCINES
ncbi:hypothetical protein BGZ61DRAFT_480474 [Ilyonectria robusta]|uniref:uncharacterized protein n=1 Tax=Ilyonectria robusta TaxID=1079257 RepID=UPI001E8D9426|nr:uncharacterized protein BGZ61DRAFT_480474 [Ilyonectria robusta]KAH8683415.1 hypothetical protein BGZ61DRAFT_480474 [Ilyonectria robusta]